MIPVTYPSSLSYRTTRQMVAYPITDLTGKRRWTDYIPVKFVDQTTFTVENSHNNNAYISVDMLSSNANLKEGIDYIPVYIDNAATDAWQVSATGYIPVGYSGAALSLQFAGSTFLDSRITFTRASSGTYFDNTGVLRRANRNLLTYSEQFNDASWTKLGSTITANAVVAPDGALTADTLVEDTSNGEHRVGSSNITWAGNTQYTVTFYAKAAGRNVIDILFGTAGNWVNSERTASFDLSNGTIALAPASPATASITNVGNGWYRCAVTATTVASPSASGVFVRMNSAGAGTASYTGNGTSGIYIWGAQLEEGSSATVYAKTVASTSGAPRFDHDPVTKAPRGLLIEEQRTNLLTYSEQFDGGIGWGASNLTVTANALVSPGGTITADQLVPSTGGSVLRLVSQTVSSLSASTTYTLSVFAKIQNIVGAPPGIALRLRNSGGTSDAYSTFTLSTGTTSGTVAASGVDFTGGTATIANVGNGWYRCTMTATVVNALTSPRAEVWYGGYQGTTNVGDIFIWGAQLEAGSFATSYIPTVAAQVTRSADSASMTGSNFSSWYRQDEGTFYTESQILYSTGGTLFPGVFSANNGTTTNAVMSYYINTDRQNLWVRSSGTIVTDIGPASTANALFKFAGAFKVNDFAATSNGLAVVTDTAGALPATLDRLVIGSQALGNAPLNGHIRKLAFYPARLSNTALQALTA